MQIDKTTLHDLSIFHHEEEQSVFHHLNFTQTNGGREYLRWILATPLNNLQDIQNTQHTIQQLLQVIDVFPTTITNGTVMVLDRFYDSQIDSFPSHPNTVNSFAYQIISKSDFSLTRYSIGHFISFFKGLQQIVDVFQQQNASTQLTLWCNKIALLLEKSMVKNMIATDKNKKLSPVEVLQFGRFLRDNYKSKTLELIDIYSRLDAYLSLATACKKYNYSFPTIQDSKQPFLTAQGLYHPLLQQPVHYNVGLHKQSNFLFLTGANMAGKSTFIKAVGISAYLANIGMGVPAQNMQLSLFDGLLSNIQVADNIVKGESYFFNEVQRIKSTIEKISDGKNWLILIDELFKGTNVQDAMKCSTTVIEGLHKMQNALFVLSTHLYEIGADLQQYPNILFRYFETAVADNELVFSYQLKEGISNDRLGYLILKREGVVSMLQQL